MKTGYEFGARHTALRSFGRTSPPFPTPSLPTRVRDAPRDRFHAQRARALQNRSDPPERKNDEPDDAGALEADPRPGVNALLS